MSEFVVVDASIAIKWVLNEQDSSTALALMTEWADSQTIMIAPTLLAYEVTNTFHRRIQSGKLSVDDANEGLEDVIFKVVTFVFSEKSAFNARAMELARQFGLPAAYDAHYLALAESKNCELWTADERMWNTVKGKLSWVRWLNDYQPGII